MRTFFTAVAVGTMSVAALNMAAPSASAVVIYSNGFETDATDWQAPAARVASGSNGITSASGSFHAEANGAPFSRWGGYNYGAGNNVPTVFKEYTSSLDIYLDVAGGAANDTRFDFDSAVSNSAGAFLRDFIFNAGFYNSADVTGPGAGTDRFVISASNNTQPGSAFAKNPGRDPIAISTTGWYTFEHHFYESAGLLNVDMTITDSSNNLVHSWTMGANPLLTQDAIGTVGGNRYGWFDHNGFSVMAFDNASLDVVPEPTGLALLGLSGAALGLRRRRHH
jgi:hypothetical protein